ncbi:MAG: ATP-binding protein [Candidatus Micrarchaeia archaeon]|jgi:hypothetical protein
MYFELAPKENKEDFFNHENEYFELKNAIKRKDPIIAVLGVRRVGKTSLLNILYHETKTLKLWIDGRMIQNPKIEIPLMINEVIETKKSKIFGRIEGLSVSAFGFGVGIKTTNTLEYTTLKKKIESLGGITVFIDEVQRIDNKSISDLLSYFYDKLPKISFVLSGSEVGLVEEILGEQDGTHPLYGRHITKIIMKRFDKNGSFSFLQSGFQQIDVPISTRELKEVINELDGLVGWLTLYGYKKGFVKDPNALKETIKLASQIVAGEIENFLKNRKDRRLYILILQNASAPITWTELKLRVEKNYKKQINSNTFSFALSELAKYSFIENTLDGYKICDPILFNAVMQV